MNAAPRIVIAAGGTAGHVVPALAVAEALRAEGAEVSFIGGERAEAQLVPAAGFELRRLVGRRASAAPNPLRALRAAGLAAAAVPRARTILSELAPHAVMGGGGYVAGPVGLAAASLRLPLVLTEADSHLGPHQPAARAARPPRLPGVPAPRAGRRALPRDRAPDPAARRRAARRPARASASSRTTSACSCSAARSARARSTRPPPRRSPARRSGCCTSAGAATTRSWPPAISARATS